jgi:hypothetical protein
MTLPLNDVYLKIGKALANSIGHEWQSVLLNVILKGEGALSLDGIYVASDGVNHGFPVPDAIFAEVYYLYTEMSKSPKGKWKKMTYKIVSDGQFEVNFDY